MINRDKSKKLLLVAISALVVVIAEKLWDVLSVLFILLVLILILVYLFFFN